MTDVVAIISTRIAQKLTQPTPLNSPRSILDEKTMTPGGASEGGGEEVEVAVGSAAASAGAGEPEVGLAAVDKVLQQAEAALGGTWGHHVHLPTSQSLPTPIPPHAPNVALVGAVGTKRACTRAHGTSLRADRTLAHTMRPSAREGVRFLTPSPSRSHTRDVPGRRCLVRGGRMGG